ncbi:hypothetical protein [Microbacterium excoecariae]|uniref:hypothetical protein n=1 Tax=Microbacterium excoecariae TaxID=2715210 RepID=UPI001409994D|nr:hypothetical protein [Microbacterium excoecariae]NHI16883.1 hypothetical protein [Microbacterium excoecariae]
MVSLRVKEAAADEVVKQLGSGLRVALQPRTVFDVIVNDEIVTTLSRAQMAAEASRGDDFATLRNRDKDYRDALIEVATELAVEALMDLGEDGDFDDAERIVRMRRVADCVRQVQVQLLQTAAPVIASFDDPHDG